MAADIATVGVAVGGAAVGLAALWRRWHKHVAETADAARAAADGQAAGGVEWQVWLDGRYEPYEPAVSTQLEAAYLGGHTAATIMVRDVEYCVTLQGTTRAQAPVGQPKRTRAVRRVSAGKPHTSQGSEHPVSTSTARGGLLHFLATAVAAFGNGCIGVVGLMNGWDPPSALLNVGGLLLILTALAALCVSSAPHGERALYPLAQTVLIVSGAIKGLGAAGILVFSIWLGDNVFGAVFAMFGVAGASLAVSELYLACIS